MRLSPQQKEAMVKLTREYQPKYALEIHQTTLNSLVKLGLVEKRISPYAYTASYHYRRSTNADELIKGQ